jgi:hypothetical protein
MSGQIAERAIKRSNKDLGRVLAIAYLAQEQGSTDFRPWGVDWFAALKHCFPIEWRGLVIRTGSGLEALLESEEDFEEAHYTCVNGLLASLSPEMDDLREAGHRVLGDAIGKLEELAESSPIRQIP